MKRRAFIQSGITAASALSISAVGLSGFKSRKPTYGVQLFTIPGMVDKDLKGTLKLLAEIGYKEVEFFGPYPFSDPETIEGWKQLASMLKLNRNAFYGYSVQETAAMLKE